LREYRGAGEDALLAAFHAGEANPPPDPARDEWDALLDVHRRAGRVMRRVHIITEPLTDYLRYELTWAYGPSVAAGEDIRIIAVSTGWPEDLPPLDFWLFDANVLLVAHYTEDTTLLGFEHVTDPARIVQACRWRDAALHHAQPWADYIAARPELAARVPVLPLRRAG
jgi:hypothetical protein